MPLHEIGPLDFIFEILHLSTDVGRQDFEDPPVAVLVGHGPELYFEHCEIYF